MKIRIKFHLLLLQLCKFLVNQRKHKVTWKNRHYWYVWLWNYGFCFLKIHTLWISFKIIIQWLTQCFKNINVNVTCPTLPPIFVPRVEPNPVALFGTSSVEPGAERPRVTWRRFHRARELPWLPGWYNPVSTSGLSFPNVSKECQTLLMRQWPTDSNDPENNVHLLVIEKRKQDKL